MTPKSLKETLLILHALKISVKKAHIFYKNFFYKNKY